MLTKVAVVAAALLAPAAHASRPGLKVTRRVAQEDCTIPDARPPANQRLYYSPAIESTIATMQPKFKDPNLGQIFANTLPNVIDTTVFSFLNTSQKDGPDTFVVTGDINAMWLRDSTNQVLPYLRFVQQDAALQQLVLGLIARQAKSILIDPYANAFQIDSTAGQGPHSDDSTTKPAFAGTTIDAMTPAIFERKWEADSLANALRLSALYYNASGGDTRPYTPTWLEAVQTVLDTFAAQQLDTEEEDNIGGAPYQFQRQTGEPSDSLEHARGPVAKHTGLIKCGFRGSDDALTLPFNIPENAFASVALRQVAVLLNTLGQDSMATTANALAATIEAGIQQYGIYTHPLTGKQQYAFEVDGFGNYYFMDDANIPSLIGMPYYGFTDANDTIYQNTRAAILSPLNPYYLCGSTGCGIGGPHNGYYWVWPMASIAQAWTSTNDTEIATILTQLTQSSACTGLIHESYDRNSFNSYTRPWFAWVNSLMADLLLKIADEKPYLIFN